MIAYFDFLLCNGTLDFSNDALSAYWPQHLEIICFQNVPPLAQCLQNLLLFIGEPFARSTHISHEEPYTFLHRKYVSSATVWRRGPRRAPSMIDKPIVSIHISNRDIEVKTAFLARYEAKPSIRMSGKKRYSGGVVLLSQFGTIASYLSTSPSISKSPLVSPYRLRIALYFFNWIVPIVSRIAYLPLSTAFQMYRSLLFS